MSTAADIMLRPQPVGVHPFPAGMLLLPPIGSSYGFVLDQLLQAASPKELPDDWRFFGAAAVGGIEEALQLLRKKDSTLSRYNQFVLTGDPAQFARLTEESRGDLLLMARMAVYAHGLSDEPPNETATSHLDAELLATARMMQAARRIEKNDSEGAFALLLDGCTQVESTSPVFASQLYAQAAQLKRGRDALPFWRRAAGLLERCGSWRLRAESWVALGEACQQISSEEMIPDRRLLVEATNAYQSALSSGLSIDSAPQLYAMVQNNLGLAYLAMPMDGEGKRLRSAVAVQCFREAIRVYDREHTQEAWISTQLNLANALQHAHSAHPQENIARAVEIYEDLLALRPRAMDPVGHARLLANQANALAHLGIFSPALAKATEAHKLLHWHHEPELAETMLHLAATINERLGAATSADGPGGPQG